jgi:hypothetical protein
MNEPVPRHSSSSGRGQAKAGGGCGRLIPPGRKAGPTTAGLNSGGFFIAVAAANIASQQFIHNLSTDKNK